MHTEITPTCINAQVYFESKISDTYNFKEFFLQTVNKAKTNNVSIIFYLSDFTSSWINNKWYQYNINLNIQITPAVNLADYYDSLNIYKVNYSFDESTASTFLKYFLILLFTTEYYVPTYFEDVTISLDDKQFNVEYAYIHSDELAKCDCAYLYNKLMSREVVTQLNKWYHQNNIEYENRVKKLIDKYSVSLYDYLSHDDKMITSDRKIVIL